MFKFDFDIDDAEDISGLEHLGIIPPNSKNTIQPQPDPSPEVLEPFSEISLTQLVRAQQSLQPRKIETLTLLHFSHSIKRPARRPSTADIPFAASHTALLVPERDHPYSAGSLRRTVSTHIGRCWR